MTSIIEEAILTAKESMTQSINELYWSYMHKIDKALKDSRIERVKKLEDACAALEILREHVQSSIDPEEIEMEVKQRRNFINNINETLGH